MALRLILHTTYSVVNGRPPQVGKPRCCYVTYRSAPIMYLAIVRLVSFHLPNITFLRCSPILALPTASAPFAKIKAKLTMHCGAQLLISVSACRHPSSPLPDGYVINAQPEIMCKCEGYECCTRDPLKMAGRPIKHGKTREYRQKALYMDTHLQGSPPGSA